MLLTHLCLKLLLSSVAQSQGCTDFSAHTNKGMGGDRIRTTDLNWPKVYSMAYDVMHNECFEGRGRSLLFSAC